MSLSRYSFAHAISGFFEFPTENARALVPRPLEPVELHHGTSVLSMTVFDFTSSVVGAYRELVFSVAVMPLVKPGERLPKSALFPYLVATTTAASREHAISTWHLPHWMEDVDIDLVSAQGRMEARIRAGGTPVADLCVGEHSWEPVRQLYQSFMRGSDEVYVADILMEGRQSEHEDESGRLRLHDHAFHGTLALPEVSDIPFREVWMRDGVQTFESLVSLPAS
ncbi:MAG TPA: hypothetical protein VFO85_06200 [Vicinamibacteria bacterium]|nr:hypothetical protein [Vicinamibacteria bacterium]